MGRKKSRTYVCNKESMAKYLIRTGHNPYKVKPDRDNPVCDVFLFTATLELREAIKYYIDFEECRAAAKEANAIWRECLKSLSQALQ